jgi:hypothetical protein
MRLRIKKKKARDRVNPHFCSKAATEISQPCVVALLLNRVEKTLVRSVTVAALKTLCVLREARFAFDMGRVLIVFLADVLHQLFAGPQTGREF